MTPTVQIESDFNINKILGAIDEGLIEATEKVAEMVLDEVENKQGQLVDEVFGYYHAGTKLRKVGKNEYEVFNDVTARNSGEHYAPVIEFGFKQLNKKIWLINAPDLVEWLIKKHGWAKTEREGVLGRGDAEITYITLKYQGVHPFREGFYAAKAKTAKVVADSLHNTIYKLNQMA